MKFKNGTAEMNDGGMGAQGGKVEFIFLSQCSSFSIFFRRVRNKRVNQSTWPWTSSAKKITMEKRDC